MKKAPASLIRRWNILHLLESELNWNIADAKNEIIEELEKYARPLPEVFTG